MAFEGSQPFLFDQPTVGANQIYDEIRNATALGGSTTIYKVTETGIPSGGIQIEYAPTAISPIVQFLDSIRKLLPWWVWVLIAFLLIYFKKQQ